MDSPSQHADRPARSTRPGTSPDGTPRPAGRGGTRPATGSPAGRAALPGLYAPNPAAAAGDGTPLTQDLLVELYVAHRTELVELAHLVAPADAMAEGIVQAAFVRMHRRRRKGASDPLAAVRAEVLRIARRRSTRLSPARRAAARSVRRSAGTDHRDSGATGPGRAGKAPAGDNLIEDDPRTQLVAGLRALPSRQRQCLVLRWFEGLPPNEIATLVGMSDEAVASHLERGAQALAQREVPV